MRYEIDSRTLAFNGEGVVELFATMNGVCADQRTDFLVVGAFARDLILHNLFGKKAGVLTRDIDFGILLGDWTAFEKVTQDLMLNHGFEKGRFPHLFVTPKGVPTDLLPFGRIEQQRAISFPEAENYRINMMGFSEAWETRLQINLDGKVEFSIPTPEALIMLKLVAWKDRTPAPVALKHVTDISLIFDGYFDAMVDTLDDDPYLADIYELSGDPFDLNWYAAVAIGRKISHMVAPYPETRAMLLTILSEVSHPKMGRFFRERMEQVLRVDHAVVPGIIKRLYDELER
ncbi:MAG: hypothetical protein AAFN92_11240 [Bacteroidota bacterium]